MHIVSTLTVAANSFLVQVPRRIRVQISRKRNDDEDATVRLQEGTQHDPGCWVLAERVGVFRVFTVMLPVEGSPAEQTMRRSKYLGFGFSREC